MGLPGYIRLKETPEDTKGEKMRFSLTLPKPDAPIMRFEDFSAR